ncbi:MAG: TIGR02300 family protein [Devosiaceae bacterium]|nr:TIGR02300 family protein [Devosiaceae bacterium]
MKFYDLNRDPIVCPGCGEKFVIAADTPKEKEPEKPAKEEVKAEPDNVVEANPDVISLDEAEDEEIAAEDIPDVDDVEVDDNVNADQQDTFLESDDEDGDKIDLGIPVVDINDEN